MLSRQFRLTKDQDFKRAYRKGAKSAEGELAIWALPNRRSIARIGIVVSKKQYPKAHARNRIKRQLREVTIKLFEKIKTGNDIIISLKQPLKEVKFEKIIKRVEGALKKGNLLNG